MNRTLKVWVSLSKSNLNSNRFTFTFRAFELSLSLSNVIKNSNNDDDSLSLSITLTLMNMNENEYSYVKSLSFSLSDSKSLSLIDWRRVSYCKISKISISLKISLLNLEVFDWFWSYLMPPLLFSEKYWSSMGASSLTIIVLKHKKEMYIYR